MLGKRPQLKATALLVFFHWLEKLVNIADHIQKLISSMVLGLLDQLQIFSQLYLIEFLELLRLLTVLGPLELCHLIYPRLLAGFGMLVFFTNISLMEFPVRNSLF